MSEKSQHSWHFDPTVNLGHLLTTGTIIVAFVIWAIRLESKVETLDQYNHHQDILIESYQSGVYRSMSRIENSLVRIEEKLDRKADKRN